MEFQLQNPSIFPNGTEVAVYDEEAVPDQTAAPTGEPVEGPVTVENDKATFTALSPFVDYWAGAEVSEGVWRYVRFTVAGELELNGIVSVNPEVVEIAEEDGLVVVDEIDGVVVSESGRLEINYSALIRSVNQPEGEEETPEQTQDEIVRLYLDDEEILDGPFGEPLDAGNLNAGPEIWQLIATNAAGFDNHEASEGEEALDYPPRGPWKGPAALAIAAAPGIHKVSVKVQCPGPEQGSFEVKERRLTCITGNA